MAGQRTHILVVCTANQCRSALGAGSVRARAAERSLPVTASSAGIQAVPGLPATPPTVDAARRLGLDLATHASTTLEPAEIRHADLILGLERRHVQEVVLKDPIAFPKTFTVKELVRRGSEVGPRAPDEPLAAWLARVHEGRRPIDLLGVSADDDVTDPTGSNAVDHRTTAEEIDALVSEVLALIYP